MIRLDHIAWKAGAFGLENISFAVPTGCYGVLMGPTGGGKTSLLELICGLRRPTAGAVWLGEREVTHLAPGERGLGYVPQDGALFPTMTVRENLGFALRVSRQPADKIARRVAELAKPLGIAALLDRRPTGLSGGERQRVALGRALAARPQVLLLDEPLSALDDDTREPLADLLHRVQRESAVTVLHVTHHLSEAARLADVLFRLEAGRVTESKVTPASEPRGVAPRSRSKPTSPPFYPAAPGAWPVSALNRRPIGSGSL
ncbi:MAG: ATP-binding cassette domain-containing protein [Verrucomicrobiota bacterium]